MKKNFKPSDSFALSKTPTTTSASFRVKCKHIVSGYKYKLLLVSKIVNNIQEFY